MALVFRANQIGPGMKASTATGGYQAPRKRRVLLEDLSRILLDSARKNRANPLAEYSTLYPETSSASASGRSNGCRFVSASVVIKKRIKTGSRGAPNQPALCLSPTVERLRDPLSSRRDSSVAPRETS